MAETDFKTKQAQWTEAWIEQQRELLRKQAEANAAAGDETARGLGTKWRDLGDAYLEGVTQFARNAGSTAHESAVPFKVGEEFLDLWRNTLTSASAVQQGAVQGLSDLLGRLPPLGLAREHTEAWRELAAAQSECQQLEQELRSVLMKVQADALVVLEQRVQERANSGKPVASYRDLYDLWVECAEQVYAQVAHSDAYSRLQGQLGNAAMRLRSRQQKIAEYALRQLDLPTRSEINSVHLQLRALKQKVAALEKPDVKKSMRKPLTRSRLAKKNRGRKR